MIRPIHMQLMHGDNPTSATDFLPRKLTLPALKGAAARCKGCSLYQHATQTVFGEGPAGARMVLVGETPGDLKSRAREEESGL